jgi:hypothetical protein
MVIRERARARHGKQSKKAVKVLKVNHNILLLLYSIGAVGLAVDGADGCGLDIMQYVKQEQDLFVSFDLSRGSCRCSGAAAAVVLACDDR